MTLKETLRAMKRALLNEVTPSKMPSHSDKPIFYTPEQEMAMNWEARMIARAMHQLDNHTSIPSLHNKILHDMHEKFYANPDKGLKNIVSAYRTCMEIKDDKEQMKFERNYVAQKVTSYRRTHLNATVQGR